MNFSCLQSVKDTKFESNSQQSDCRCSKVICCLQSVKGLFCSCLQSVKDTKFESNSQHTSGDSGEISSCLQSVKDTKFESNSQLPSLSGIMLPSCLQSVKDTKFESNSQRSRLSADDRFAVCSPSKIQSLKAIHNEQPIKTTEQ